MSELSPQVANWLFNVLQPQYLNKQLTYTHIYQFLQVHLNKNLKFRIRTSIYTSSNSGQSNLLINLFGSVFINPQVSVSVEIWIPLGYPFVAPNSVAEDNGVPVVYVTPDNSKGWFLKPGNHVDGQGRFYHPYLTSWYHECTQRNPNSLKKYNLLELVNVLKDSFSKDEPIYLQQGPSSHNSPISTRNTLKSPPKPAKIPINSAVASVHTLRPEVPGPPLPVKPNKAVINNTKHTSKDYNSNNPITPLKYQSPLPLPTSTHLNISEDTTHILSNQQNPSQAPLEYPKSNRHEIIEHYSGQKIEKTDVEKSQNVVSIDLMDKDDRSTSSSPFVASSIINNRRYDELLEKLSTKINECLTTTDPSCDNINISLSTINHNKMKINALYQQLSHHKQQAIANSENLESHIKYLTQQLGNITSLNNELVKLDELNSRQDDTVSTSFNGTFHLDDLIIPDSTLVKQLYDIASEIKATKDTINLISGNFHSQSEIINDDRMDVCVKTVRGLGRELFWLELIKNEIANNIMGLSSS